MGVGRLRNMGRSFCCTRKYQKGRKWRESESKGRNLLNTDLSGMENYSVNPVAIGKWIDGRNIYRQVYTGTAPTEPDGVISDHDAGYILINDFHNEIIDFAGYIQNIAGAKAPIKGYYIDQSDWLAVWHQAGAIRMRMPPNGYYVGGPFVLIVTYLQ